MHTSLKDEFKFYVPIDITKAKKDKLTGEMILEGLAGDGTRDSEGENLNYSKFDTNRMFYVNWEHSKEPEDVIGVIKEKQLQKGGKFFIKAKLFSGHKKAEAAYQLQQFLELEGENLGFSVEGKVLERDPINEKIVVKAELYGVALCKVPVNPTTFARIAKAFASGATSDDLYKSDEEEEEEEEDDSEVEKMTTGDMAPAMPESVEKKPKNQENYSNNKKVLSKSEIYLRIFNKFTQDHVLADRMYSLIKSISSKMEKDQVTEDVIRKAEEILGLVSTEKSAEEDIILKGGQADMSVDGDENGGSIEVLQKSMNEAYKGYMEKAEAYKSMCKSKGVECEMPGEQTLQKSELDLDLVKGVILGAMDEKLGFIDRLEKSIEIRTKALGSLLVDDREKISNISDELSKANASIETITQFNQDFRERLNIVEKTPVRRGVTSYQERFAGEGQDLNKSEKTFSISANKVDLIKSINDTYGSEMENPKNMKMLEAAATLEMTGMLDDGQVNLLKSEGYGLVR